MHFWDRGGELRFAVVGGGISGLAAAWHLLTSGDEPEVVIYEPGRLGGKLQASEFQGIAVDEGPDCFITRAQDAVQLCEEIGLGDDLVVPAASRAMLYSEDRLRPLPEGLVLGAPARLVPLARSGILSPRGLARALLDLVLPASPATDDVYQLVAARFGTQVADRLVEPLLGSIHAGPIRGLSAAATAPQLLAARQSGHSLLLGLRRLAAGASRRPGEARPLFMAPRPGMGHMAAQLADRVAARGATVLSLAVERVLPGSGGAVLEPDGEHYDGVVLAVPAPVASGLVGHLSRDGEDRVLAGVGMASVAVATMAFHQDELDVGPGLSGILVPPGSGLLMTACSFGSHKWPHWAAPGQEVLRVSVGRAGDERWLGLPDEELVGRLAGELGHVLAPAGGQRRDLGPLAWRVSRWPASFPQYKVGHPVLMRAVHTWLAQEHPTVSLAGSSYEGAGVPACIASGRKAAASALAASPSAHRSP